MMVPLTKLQAVIFRQSRVFISVIKYCSLRFHSCNPACFTLYGHAFLHVIAGTPIVILVWWTLTIPLHGLSSVFAQAKSNRI